MTLDSPKDRSQPSMNTRSKSSLPTVTTLSATPPGRWCATNRERGLYAGNCPSRRGGQPYSLTLASFAGARDFAQGAEPSGPPRCGLGWSFSFCRARSPGRDAVVPDGHGPGRQPLRRRQAPRVARCWITSRPYPRHQQRDAAGAPAPPHPRLHQCRPVTDYSCHRPDATAIGQFFEAIPHLAEHAQTACGNAEALFRLA
jgi:hypothetical protein